MYIALIVDSKHTHVLTNKTVFTVTLIAENFILKEL